MKKKVLINCCLLSDHKRGMGVYLENVLKNLAELQEHELILVVNNTYANKLLNKLNRVNHKVIKFPLPLVLVEQFILPFLLLFYKPSLYVNSGNTATLVSLGIPYIMLIHDISYTKPSSVVPSSNSIKRKLGKVYRKTSIFLKIKKATHIITVSEFARNDIQKQYFVSEKKISVVPNGIAPEFIFSGTSNLPNKRVPRLVFITGSDEQKNMRRTLSALKSCYDDNRFSLDTIIVGMDSDIYGYNLDSRVNFVGYKYNNQLPKILAESDFFMLPSLYESFGIPALEAYSSGCKLYLSNLGALNSIFGNRAVYFDPWSKDEIKGAFDDMQQKKYSAPNRTNDQNFLQKYLWIESARKFSSLIEELS